MKLGFPHPRGDKTFPQGSKNHESVQMLCVEWPKTRRKELGIFRQGGDPLAPVHWMEGG
jgi:hypothetical protein